MGSRKLGALVAGPALVIALVTTVATGPAQAAPTDAGPAHAPSQAVERQPAVADFEGRSIDLSGDWGQARACLVWRQGGVMECFRTAQALAARENGLASRRSAQGSAGMATTMSAYSCSSSLSLYDYGGYGGRELDFWDRGFWQNLGDYGFDNATSSYIVGGCYAHLADGSDGGGWWYPGATSPYHGEPYMYSSWNNRVSSIYIE